MEQRDLRGWLSQLEAAGELHRITAPVDWNLEISEILRRALARRGPAILFENIKGYRDGWCTRMFANGLGNKTRLAMMFGLPKDSSYADIVALNRRRLKQPIAPVVVASGPVKENIIPADQVNVLELPVPFWHEKDGGRYVNTWCGVVTRDPDTGEHNVGAYRGMIVDHNRIAVVMEATRDWARHAAKYRARGEDMPVAVVYGWDPAMVFAAGHPFARDEYGIMGAIRQQPVELVRCETSDLLVPASAEIVVEGTISADPATYEFEGPFGEFTGTYGGARRRRPVLAVKTITHRNDPIYRGNIEGPGPGAPNETSICAFVGWNSALWEVLESAGHAGAVLDAVVSPWTMLRIRKSYQGQARHIAAAIWGSKLVTYIGKTIVVVDEDVDIHEFRQVQIAIQNRANPATSYVTFPLQAGGSGDPALPEHLQDEVTFGSGLQTRLLIDATVDWRANPPRPEWDGRRLPPVAYRSPPHIVEQVERRWHEFGL